MEIITFISWICTVIGLTGSIILGNFKGHENIGLACHATASAWWFSFSIMSTPVFYPLAFSSAVYFLIEVYGVYKRSRGVQVND